MGSLMRLFLMTRNAYLTMTYRSLFIGLLAVLYGLFSIYMVLLYRMEPLDASERYSIKERTGTCVNRTEMLDYLAEFEKSLHEEITSESLRLKLKTIIELTKGESACNSINCVLINQRENITQSPVDENVNTTQDLLEVCPEKWHGREENVYYLNTWKTENCTNVLPFSSILTVLLYPTPIANCSEQNSILSGLQKTHSNLQVFIANVRNYCKPKSHFPHVRYISIKDQASNPGHVWNTLVAKVTTPYVLIGRNLDHFMWFSDLKRPIRILSNNNATKIVGGAVRNSTGHWRVGCYQSSLRNYILEYQEGYYNSKNDCMFCDHLIGPFVTRTSFLRENPFSDSLPSEILFEDFFLKIKQSNHSVVNCPDVMYFASDPTFDTKLSSKSVWLPLVRKWELNRIVVPVNRVFAYSCNESGLKCSISKLVKSFLMPICCLEQFAKAVVIIDKFCRKHKIPYEFAGGTVMGIIKMGDVMPWDHDGDLFYIGNYSIFNKSKEELTKQGVGVGPLYFYGGHYKWIYSSPEITVDMCDFGKMSYDSLQDDVFRLFPTQAQLHGHWVYVMPNPGGYSRNNYGYETLKHTHHYQFLKQKFDEPYKGGYFKKCKKSSHHACLDHFSSDGSLQFVVPN